MLTMTLPQGSELQPGHHLHCRGVCGAVKMLKWRTSSTLHFRNVYCLKCILSLLYYRSLNSSLAIIYTAGGFVGLVLLLVAGRGLCVVRKIFQSLNFKNNSVSSGGGPGSRRRRTTRSNICHVYFKKNVIFCDCCLSSSDYLHWSTTYKLWHLFLMK